MTDGPQDYVRRGLAVLPIYGVREGVCACKDGAACKRGPGKHPLARLVPSGVLDAAADPATVEAWTPHARGANWAIATGTRLPDGRFLAVLDIDPRGGGDASLDTIIARHGPLPATPTVNTGSGGRHFYLATHTEVASQRGTIGDGGIDLKASHGYVVAPPSRHVCGGVYAWAPGAALDDVAIADAPEWLVAETRRGPRPGVVSTRGHGDAFDTYLGRAFAAAGWLGEKLNGGRRMVVCPWADQHTDGRGLGSDSSSVLLAPPRGRLRIGIFVCAHSHCVGRRASDVVAALPQRALELAWKAYPKEGAELACMIDRKVA